MKIQIENLKAQMRGVNLNNYQKALALNEYHKLIDYVERLEQLATLDITKSLPIIEGKTKSNVKNNTQTRRLAPPPPPPDRKCKKG